MSRFRLGLLFVATGIFIPLVSLPFTEGYRRAASVVENIHWMTLPILPDKYEPNFKKIDRKEVDLRQIKNYSFVEVTSTGEVLPHVAGPADIFDALVEPDAGNIGIFSNANVHSDDEIARAVKARKQQIGKLNAKYLMYYGWTVSREAVRLPFSAVVAVSVFLAFVGVVLLIFASARR